MFDIERFVADCRAARQESSPELAVKEVVARAMSRPGEVEQALGTPQCGEVVTLHRSPELTVIKAIWAPGISFYPHDHRMWTVIGLYGGREDNVFYRRTTRGLEEAGGKHIEIGETAVLGHTVVHGVANPLRQFTGAIHVYGGDLFSMPRSEWDPETLEERPYDLDNAKRVFAEANERWRAQSAARS